jgi:hypothetical protein
VLPRGFGASERADFINGQRLGPNLDANTEDAHGFSIAQRLDRVSPMTEAKYVTLGSPAALKFAELMTFKQDLDDALDALAMAGEIERDSQDTQDLWSLLVSAAVIAYWRCFPSFADKPNLEKYVTLTVDEQAVHERSKAWRNRVVAHTDSGTKRTLTLAKLTNSHNGYELGVPFAMAVEQPAPDEFVAEFAQLVQGMLSQVELAAHAAANTANQLSQDELAELWQRPDNDADVDDSVLQWDPSRKRLSSFVRLSIPLDPPPG